MIAGGDDRDRHSLPREDGSYVESCDGDIKGLHVAWTPDLGYAAVDPAVQALCENAAAEFESLGCHVEVVNPGWEDSEEIFRTIVAAQFYAHWSDQLPAQESELDPTLVKFIRSGGAISTRDYVLAMERARAYWHEAQTFLARFDLLLTPTTAVAPFPVGRSGPREIAGQAVSVLGWMPFTFPFNLTGQPAASVPAGVTDDGLPVGLQIIGRRNADRTVLAYLKVGLFKRVEETRLNVGRDDVPRRSDAVAEPAGDRTTTSSDLEAPPSPLDSQRLEVADGTWVH